MKSFVMNKEQRKITRNPVENGQQADSVPLEVANQLAAVQSQIDAATDQRPLRYGVGPVTLVAVSKRQPENKIDAALEAGQRVFGENRVQEAIQRWTDRRKVYSDIILHLIGPLQTNKVSDAVTLFNIIEVVDRPKLAKALSAEMICQNRQLECYIQVNTGEEEQKSGIVPDDRFDAFKEDKSD